MLGRHLKEHLTNHNTVFISSKDADLRVMQDVEDIMNLHKPHRVIHLAAKVGGLQDNLKHPVDFYNDNN